MKLKTLIIMSGSTILILAALAFLYLKGQQAPVDNSNGVPVVTKITGTVYTAGGIALRSVAIELSKDGVIVDRATTSSFGKYELPNIVAGATYTVTASNKRYRFAPVTFTANAGVNTVDFTGLE